MQPAQQSVGPGVKTRPPIFPRPVCKLGRVPGGELQAALQGRPISQHGRQDRPIGTEGGRFVLSAVFPPPADERKPRPLVVRVGADAIKDRGKFVRWAVRRVAVVCLLEEPHGEP